MINTLIFLIIISILIFVHEFGHLYMARRQGVKVEKFAIGFGPKLLGFIYKEIDCKICLIPFGGYVKLAGDSRQEYKGNNWEYLYKTPMQRAKIVFFGPLFNYILAFLLLWLVFCMGYPQTAPVVGEVLDNMPAKSAGIMKNDKIVSIDNQNIKYWDDVLAHIKSNPDKKEVEIKVLRDNKEIILSMMPIQKTEKNLFGDTIKVSLIGIAPSGDIIKEKYNVFQAFGVALFTILKLTWFTLRSIFSLIIGHLSLRESVSGPIGIFHITSAAAAYGFGALVHVTSMLSLALAIFNVLPIPVLDGGHIMFLTIEKLRKKPLSDKVEQKITDIGFGFILILAAFIIFNDIIKYGYWDRLNGILIKWYSR